MTFSFTKIFIEKSNPVLSKDKKKKKNNAETIEWQCHLSPVRRTKLNSPCADSLKRIHRKSRQLMQFFSRHAFFHTHKQARNQTDSTCRTSLLVLLNPICLKSLQK